CKSRDAAAKTSPAPTSRPSAFRQLQNQRAFVSHRLTQIFTDSAITGRASPLCHSDRSGGISNYFCLKKLVSTEISRDVSTSLDMTKRRLAQAPRSNPSLLHHRVPLWFEFIARFPFRKFVGIGDLIADFE